MSSTGNQKLCAWSGLVFLSLFFVGFWPLAQFLPPPGPEATPEQIAAFYQSHTGALRFGMALLLIGVGFMAPWTAVISEQMRRIEGARVLSYAQLVAGGVAMMAFVLCSLLWAVAAFRPDRDPNITLLLDDLAWISILTPVGPFVFQFLSIGVAVLRDAQKTPVFPRWFGYFNFWTALAFMPGVAGFCIKHGPFAWDGLFVFWLPVGMFGAWYLVSFVLLLKAIDQPN